MSKNFNILLRNGFVPFPAGDSENDKSLERLAAIATIAVNISYYGYALNSSGFAKLHSLSIPQLKEWWPFVEKELKSITGESIKMGDFVVYKNFPKEVLDKSEGEYWIAQMLMYWGVSSDLFTKKEEPRDGMEEKTPAKVLQVANPLTLEGVLNNLLSSTSRWKNFELQDVIFLSENRIIDFDKIAFKENLIKVCQFYIEKGMSVTVKSATDVLRLAIGFSGSNATLQEPVKFKSFKRKERKFFLSMLEKSQNLEEDFARHKEVWKRFLFSLHVGDYKGKYPNVIYHYDKLYNDKVKSLNSHIETKILAKDDSVFELLKSRPGEFRRRLSHLIDVFGSKASTAFVSDEVMKSLTNAQLVSIRRHCENVNHHKFRIFPPNGNWSKLKLEKSRHIRPRSVSAISNAIGKELKLRMSKIGPKVLDELTEFVKLPSNAGEVSPYSRGTVFPIPEDTKFIRTASYWQMKGYGNVWFDNGWNFFDKNWNPSGVCCWDCPHYDGAAFSGDPTSSKTKDNKACQVIDLYIDELIENGVEYAVWNILCFSGIPFSKADEVYASLQWGDDKLKGKLFEPARSQLSFPLTGENKTKYVCCINLKNREMIFLDANFAGNTSSARHNSNHLKDIMPAYMEYLDSLPSVYDLFRDSINKNGKGGYVLYSDKDVEINEERAYVFKPENEKNNFHKIELNDILKMKRVDTKPVQC